MSNSESSQEGSAESWGDPLIEEVIDDRYRIDALLGSGNTGRVYRATQLSVDRDVAVKVLRGSFRTNPQYRKRFFREAKVISGFNHPNIVRLIDFGEAQGGEYSFLVMELIEGVELAALLERGRLEPRFAVEIVYQTAAALIEAHNADIVHRDLKTQNILLLALSNGTLQVKVLDFGVAFPKDRRGERLTNAGQIFGTPAYMSPEQGEGRDVDAPADLYSLGVILFEMLTGELPFHEPSNLATMMKHLEAERPIPSEHGSESIPEALDTLVVDMMSRDPEERPGDARAVRERIDAIRDRVGWDRIGLDAELPIRQVFFPFLRDVASANEGEQLRELVPAFKDKDSEEMDKPPVEPVPAAHSGILAAMDDGASDSATAPASEEPTADSDAMPASEAPAAQSSPMSAAANGAADSLGSDGEISVPEAETRETEMFGGDDPEPDDDEVPAPMRASVRDETTGEQFSATSPGTDAGGEEGLDPTMRTAVVALVVLLGLAGMLVLTIAYIQRHGSSGDDEPIVIGAAEGDAESTATSGTSPDDSGLLAFEPGGPDGGADTADAGGADVDAAGDVAGDATPDSESGGEAEEEPEGEEEEHREDEGGRPDDERESSGGSASSDEESSASGDDGDREGDDSSESGSEEDELGEELEESMKWIEGKQ